MALDLTFDLDGYPSAHALKLIENFNVSTARDCEVLLDSVREAFERFGRFTHRTANENVYELATGGWSGCEDIVEALQKNRMFWALCWREHHRGGLWVFEVRGEVTP